MSRTIGLYWFDTIAEAEFTEYISKIGGTILSKDCLDISFSSGSSNVWIYEARSELAGEMEPLDPDFIDFLGSMPRLSMGLHLSHHEETGMLALRVARDLLRRWPGVAVCVVDCVLDLRLIQRTRPLLRGHFCLALSAVPQICHIIDELGGVVIDAGDADMLNSVVQELKECFDPVRERIVGLLPFGGVHVWVIEESVEGFDPSDHWLSQELCNRVLRRLGGVPASLIQVVVHRNEEGIEAERVVMSFVERVLRAQPGVMVGCFELHLAAEDLGEMLEDDQGRFIG